MQNYQKMTNVSLVTDTIHRKNRY